MCYERSSSSAKTAVWWSWHSFAVFCLHSAALPAGLVELSGRLPWGVAWARCFASQHNVSSTTTDTHSGWGWSCVHLLMYMYLCQRF